MKCVFFTEFPQHSKKLTDGFPLTSSALPLLRLVYASEHCARWQVLTLAKRQKFVLVLVLVCYVVIGF